LYSVNLFYRLVTDGIRSGGLTLANMRGCEKTTEHFRLSM